MLDLSPANLADRRNNLRGDQVAAAYLVPRQKRGRGAAGKTPFLAAVETTADGKPVSLKLGRVSGFSSNVLSGFAKHIRSIVSGGQRWPGLLQQRNRCRMHPPGH